MGSCQREGEEDFGLRIVDCRLNKGVRRRAQGAKLRENRKTFVPPMADPWSVVKKMEHRVRHLVPFTLYPTPCTSTPVSCLLTPVSWILLFPVHRSLIPFYDFNDFNDFTDFILHP
jgi:hypothetical protein